jgi:hypothetical protein
MATALLILAAAILGAVVSLLAVIVAGIRQEPRSAELSTRASGPIAAVVRRLLGLYVRRPDPAADNAERHEACLAGRAIRDSSEGDSR